MLNQGRAAEFQLSPSSVLTVKCQQVIDGALTAHWLTDHLQRTDGVG